MDRTKYSIAVKLVGHDSAVAPGYSTARYLIAQEPIGLWTRSMLEGNDNSWLLGIVLRHPDVRERRSNACLVRCGKGYHLLVTFDGADAPPHGTLIPTISIDLFLAMNQGGHFLENRIQDFGVLRDGSLFDHIQSGIDSGFTLGDLRIYVHPTVHVAHELYVDSIDSGRLVRFRWNSGSWDLLMGMEIVDLETHTICTGNTEGIVVNGNMKVEGAISKGNTVTLADPTKEKIDEESKQSKKRKTNVVTAMTLISPSKKKSNEAKNQSSTNNNELCHAVVKPRATPALPADASKKLNAVTAASSCFYAPFCDKLAKDCGGIRKGLCKEVNSGKIKIPNDDEFLDVKKKLKNKRKRERKVTAAAAATVGQSDTAHQATSVPTINDSSSMKVSSAMFNPREYLLLHKAWNNQLTANDMKDSGENYTMQDCMDASAMLNDVTSALRKNED